MKKKYVKALIVAIALTTVCGNPASSANDKKTPSLEISGYGKTATFIVNSKNLTSGEPVHISATAGFEVSPSTINANSDGKVTVKLISSKKESTGKIILRSGETRYYVDVRGTNATLPVKDLSSAKNYAGKGNNVELKDFQPSDKGYTVEFKVNTPEDGDELDVYAVDKNGNGFKTYVSQSGFGLFNSTSQGDSFTNPSTAVEGGNRKFYNNDGKAHTYRFAVLPDNRAFIYRDGIAIDTVRLGDYGKQPDWATSKGKMTENLLKNPGFEGEFETFSVKNAQDVAKAIEGWHLDILDYWCSQIFVIPEQIDNQQDFNNHVAKLTPYKWAGGWGNGNINQIIDVVPNQTYSLTALVKGGIRKKEGSLAGTMFIEEMQNRDKKAKVEIASDSWETYSLDYTTSADCKQIRVVFQDEAGKWGENRSPMEVDNVKLTGMSRKYTPKIGFNNNNTKIDYFTFDTTGAYAPAQPVIMVDFK